VTLDSSRSTGAWRRALAGQSEAGPHIARGLLVAASAQAAAPLRNLNNAAAPALLAAMPPYATRWRYRWRHKGFGSGCAPRGKMTALRRPLS